jgi:hypothetical protein
MAQLTGILLVLLALGAAAPAKAQGVADEAAAAVCERAIVAGARRGGVPVSALHAIALTETGRQMGGRTRPWPWAINREGEGHWFATRDEALAFARSSVAAGRTSFDVGCFQVNYRWHGHAFASLEAMFDQETNGTYAAQFLRTLHDELGDWSAAAGAYHSRTPEFANRYRARFDRIHAGLGGAPLVVADLGPEPEAAPDPDRPSRTRMRVRPKIITLSGTAPAEPSAGAAVAGIKVERGRRPRSVEQAEAEAAAGGPVVLSTRNAPL